MKILLLGEYSGVHKNLKEGLMELGHDAVIASSGDGYKKIPCDINLNSSLPFGLDKVIRKIKPLYKLPQFANFDVVQLMNPFIFYHKIFPWNYFYNQIKKNNEKFYMLAAGDDAYFWRYGRKYLKYGPFDDFLKYDLKSKKFYMESDSSLDFNNRLVDLVDGVIPIMHEYAISYRDCLKRRDVIPIPLNVKKINYKENKPSNKIVIFHGLNRYGFKGTRHVEEAFKILKKKYPNDLELIIDGGMPLNSYLELMRRTNVVIDQTNSYSLGVNGVYAMAMGKVVLGGAEPESLLSLGVDETPVISIQPSSSSIILAIEKLLNDRASVVDIGHQSRLFAESVHDHVLIAEKYVKTWRFE